MSLLYLAAGLDPMALGPERGETEEAAARRIQGACRAAAEDFLCGGGRWTGQEWAFQLDEFERAVCARVGAALARAVREPATAEPPPGAGAASGRGETAAGPAGPPEGQEKAAEGLREPVAVR